MARPVTGAEPPLLATEALAYAANGQRLIDGIDLAIRPQRCTVILGPNGAGKSLLLRLLHGLIRPTGGRILWKGQPIDSRARKAQAMVFQRPVMLRRSVLGNLKFALAARGVPQAQRADRAHAALAAAKLDNLGRRPARVLSGGEQQRLAMARALACEPELLLLDEPTASLDPAATQAVEALIGAATAAGISVVLVTHDPGQARRMGQDAIFLSAGRVAEAGPLGQLLDAPTSEAARAWHDGRLFVDPRNGP